MAIQIAILIDAENISHRYLNSIEEHLAGQGTLSIKRIYGDWSKGHVSNWLGIAAERGFSTAQQTQRGKNSTDARLMIEAVDLYHERKDIDIFCIVSSDADFAPLCLWLKEKGKKVVGCGEDKSRSDLRSSCSEFLVLKTSVHARSTIPRIKAA